MWLYAFGTYDSFRKEDQERIERTMNALLLLCISIGAPLAAMGLYDLQTRLERWDYNRHAED